MELQPPTPPLHCMTRVGIFLAASEGARWEGRLLGGAFLGKLFW